MSRTSRAGRGAACAPFLVGALLLVAAPSRAADPVCGNGRTEAGEACDDGNLVDGDGCSATCVIEEQCYDSGNVFSFFNWSDSYTSAGDSGVIRLFTDAVNAGRYPGRVIPRFWIADGDIPYMDDGPGRLDELDDEISNSPSGLNYPFTCSASNGRFPYFVAIGNHDVDGYGATTPPAQYDYWNNVVGPKVPVTLVGIANFRWFPSSGPDQRTTYSFDYKNAHFVVVNQYHGDPSYPSSDPVGCIRPDLMTWIDQDLAQTTRPIRFVFGHEPAWSYCSNVGGYGGDFCPVGSEDNQNPPQRPRPYSNQGAWDEPYGGHWGDSLEDSECPSGSREAYWAMLDRHDVIASYNGHTHAYSARLVQGDGTRRNDVSGYDKRGAAFERREGVFEIDSGMTHNSAGASYVLTTVRDGTVYFEAYDQIGSEAFKLIESWSVSVGHDPTVSLTAPAEGATFSQGATVSLTADAADTDGSIAQVAFYAGAILIETDTTAPYEASWIPAAPGTYTLTARATDNGNLTAISAPVSVTVNPASSNHPPQLDPIPNRTVDEGTALAFTATASDPDPETVLTFSLIGAPPGATIDPVSGAFAWTPSEDQGPGSYAIVVRVRDNAVPPASDDKTVVVTVNEVNQAPTLLPIADRSVNEGSPVALTAAATDPDRPANLLTFALTEAPAGATIDPASGAFSWTPTEAQGGASYRVTIRVADNGNPALAAATSFNVAVAKVNQAPSLATIANKTVAEGTLLTFAASATDADLPPNALTFSLVTAPAGAAIDPVTGVFTWTPSLGDLGPHSVTVAVTDDGAPPLSAQRTFTATVTGRPDLILTGLSASAAVVAPGGTLSASSSVKNQGASAAGAFVIGFHFSGDGSYGGPDDVAFPQARSLTSLGASATSTGSVSLTVPANTPLGSYALCAMADAGAALPETNEANNTRCTTGVVQVSRPDLVISAMTSNAAAVNAGGKLSVTDTLSNQGLVAAGSSRVGYRLTMNQVLGDADDVAPATTRTVSSLLAGASNQATLNLTIPATAPAGSYYVCAGADVLGAVTEINETNNVRCGTTLVEVRQPNLVTSALSTTATTVAAGASFVLSNTVTNASSMSAGGFVISFSLSGGPVYGGADDVTISQTRSRSSLGAGNSTSASTTLTVPSGTPPGSYYVCAFADSGQVVFESSEADNTACTGSTIVVP